MVQFFKHLLKDDCFLSFISFKLISIHENKYTPYLLYIYFIQIAFAPCWNISTLHIQPLYLVQLMVTVMMTSRVNILYRISSQFLSGCSKDGKHFVEVSFKGIVTLYWKIQKNKTVHSSLPIECTHTLCQYLLIIDNLTMILWHSANRTKVHHVKQSGVAQFVVGLTRKQLVVVSSFLFNVCFLSVIFRLIVFIHILNVDVLSYPVTLWIAYHLLLEFKKKQLPKLLSKSTKNSSLSHSLPPSPCKYRCNDFNVNTCKHIS